MTRDEIIRMAQEIWGASNWSDAQAGRLERFAALVAAAEREACAKVCEDNADCCNLGSPLYTILSSNATAIRARGMK